MAGFCAVALAACSADGMMDVRPPADVGSHTASIPQADLGAPVAPMTRVGRAAAEEPVSQAPQAAMSEPTYVETQSSETEPLQAPEQEPVILGAPERQLAQAFPAPSNPNESVTDFEAETPEDPLAESLPEEPDAPVADEPQGAQTLEPEEPPMSQPEPPARQAMIAYPRAVNPQPQSDYEEPRPNRNQPLSSDEVACRQQLKKLKVKYVDLKPIYDSAACQIPHPVKVSAIGGVQMQPAATLSCEMAATFAAWTRNELVPSSRWRYLSGIKTIHQGSAYSCRKIARSRTVSAHAQGNALDVMAITLNNGKKIDIKKQGLFAFRARGLLNNVRSDGCEYFTTVLGPGYNYDHRNHFHFDLMQRKRGRRACH
jgi:hypothetical protein